jgi:hypothetical protein
MAWSKAPPLDPAIQDRKPRAIESMIFYLATYPRTGNSQLQSFIAKNFCFLTSQVKTGGAGADPKSADWRLSKDVAERAAWPDTTLWNDRIYTYCRRVPEGIEVGFDRDRRWRYLASGPAPTPEVRKLLAAEPQPFFIKTHALPFEDYFDGEHVIQVHRAPGAVLWSYFRYQLDFVLARNADRMFERPPLTLDRVIDGDVAFGDWSVYHRAWRPVLEALGPRALVLRYGDMGRETAKVLETLSSFLDQPVVKFDVPDFDTYKARFAGMGLRGSEQGYEAFYTRSQLVRLWERHGAVATELGFTEPDYDLAAEAEQIERLNKISETAWTWGGTFDVQRRKMNTRLEKFMKEQAARAPNT